VRYRYQEWNGDEFPTQDRLDFFHNILDFVLTHGDEALRALDRAEFDDQQRQWLDQLIKDGLLEKAAGRWRLTPRAINAMQRRALMEVFSNLRAGRRDGHPTQHVGGPTERTEGTHPYQFGDPLSELDVAQTLRNALWRGAGSGIRGPGSGIRDSDTRAGGPSQAGVSSDRYRVSDARAGGPCSAQRPAARIPIRPEDFELFNRESLTSMSLVILLDMSGSMSRYGRFVNAKKCAMALHALIRQQYPFDTVDIVGFYSGAAIIPEQKLPFTTPKRVTLFDPVIRMRVRLNQIDEAPQHFTNLHMGLAMARQILTRRGGENKQIFIITDGEPTAHVQGEYIHLLYPPDTASAVATLKEAVRCAADGIRLSTFALIEDYLYMDWVGFIDQLTRLTKGVAFYSASGDLSSCVMESYLSGKRRKAYLS